jgi:surface antigen
MRTNRSGAEATRDRAASSKHSGGWSERLWGALARRLARLLLASLFGLNMAGCSYRLGPLEGASVKADDYTGSIAPVAAVTSAPLASPSEADLAFARAAATEVLARDEKDASQPWENPSTGARGTVTPIAAAYAQAGALCRDFLASYVRGGQESWYQGDACRDGGTWRVRDIRPLRRT